MVSRDVLFTKREKIFGFMFKDSNCNTTTLSTEVRLKTELLWQHSESVKNTSKAVFVIPSLQFTNNESYASTYALTSEGTVCSHLNYEFRVDANCRW